MIVRIPLASNLNAFLPGHSDRCYPCEIPVFDGVCQRSTDTAVYAFLAIFSDIDKTVESGLPSVLICGSEDFRLESELWKSTWGEWFPSNSAFPR